MASPLRSLLAQFRSSAQSEREKGNYFERLAVAFIKNDPGMAQEYEDAWLFSDWAAANGLNAKDTGIDAVAKIRGESTYCAIQCKFYREGYRVQKSDIDSFFTASGTHHFSRRLIIDTTDAPWSGNAEDALDNQDKPASRVGLDRLEESPIDWAAYLLKEEVRVAPRKEMRPHQLDALHAVREGLAVHDRGKMIMACGTGKTFTGLKIAEDLAGVGKRVLFLVPSLALMSQSIREWTIDAALPLRSFAVCSDVQVGKRRKADSDIAEIEAHDLDYPATTSAPKLAQRAGTQDNDRMTVVFATYQSIEVVSNAQLKHGLPEFDLIICDEAHRTTGATLEGEDESNFVKVHKQEFIAGRKRIYMTATPRVFGDSVKTKASEASAELCSMDDETLYGPTLFTRGFGWAVENGLLTDYKVLVLAVDEEMVSTGVQNRLKDGTSELKLDDATKIIGCYKALTKQGVKNELLTDPLPMKRALAFCRDIASSKLIQNEFAAVIAEYLDSDEGKAAEGDAAPLDCELEHVDGTFGAKARGRLLDWLKEDHGQNICRILTNARCLSEGVDVPALDAILFMHPRKSQIDVVQSVGRVMRRAPGKNMGYVILPIGVPSDKTPEEALNDNERYRVVWQILNALRSHDERFDAMINKADVGVDISDHIEVIAVSNKLPTKKDAKTGGPGIGQGGATDDDEDREDTGHPRPTPPTQISFTFDEFSKAIMAKIVKKCGRRDYWEDWATNIAEIAKNHITRLTALLKDRETDARRAFDAFHGELKDDLNDTISEGDAIEMLAQHIITRPVFETLFDGHKFTAENPVSRAMQRVLDVLNEANLDKESRDLEKFYASVKLRSQGITDPQAKQKLIVELYDKFFRRAFPRTTEKLGIVYTPVEIVDFIIHSVNEVLQSEFGQTLGSPGVHIIDPFTGTGTFITRLLQSGLIASEEMEHKFRHEIHANEIVLLAYYIAAINIEAVYHGLQGGDYVPFQGICLTDTFQMYESDDLISHYMPDNSERRKRQKATDIRVIMGNPPYSEGQSNANDNNANVTYPTLDDRIRETYAARTTANKKNSLYNSYIRAIRWASDRIGNAGVVAYVSNAGWIDGNSTDGLRACLAEEFTDLYVFHLRGNANTVGERRRREKGNVFGEGTRTPVAISVLVKNPSRQERGRIFFQDVGDYLDQKQKLEIIDNFHSIAGISAATGWTRLHPDDQNDWINQRDTSFDEFIKMGDKQNNSSHILFDVYSLGVNSNRDVWAYNSSRNVLAENMRSMIATYNNEIARLSHKPASLLTADYINSDPRKIKWSSSLVSRLERRQIGGFSDKKMVISTYRPFQKAWIYYDKMFVHRPGQMSSIFPEPDVPNLIISVPSPGNVTPFSALMTDSMQDLSVTAAKAGTQCFPLYFFDSGEGDEDGLFAARAGKSIRRHAITDAGLKHFQDAYPGETITKEDLFYYVYGLLHSEDYRAKYADNLSKELPRIPRVKTAGDFWAFSRAGRELGHLHVNYETVKPYPVTIKQGDLRLADIKNPEAFFRVTKWAFGKTGKEKDKTTVIYNSNITMTGIPLEAYDYVVNGKPALEWVMERQVVKTDKESGIVNDANRYAIETVGDPAYPLKLFQRVITVSLETMKIVRNLPPLGDLSSGADTTPGVEE